MQRIYGFMLVLVVISCCKWRGSSALADTSSDRPTANLFLTDRMFCYESVPGMPIMLVTIDKTQGMCIVEDAVTAALVDVCALPNATRYRIVSPKQGSLLEESELFPYTEFLGRNSLKNDGKLQTVRVYWGDEGRWLENKFKADFVGIHGKIMQTSYIKGDAFSMGFPVCQRVVF